MTSLTSIKPKKETRGVTQTTSHIMMVRPANFGFNPETASSNAFQENDKSLSVELVREKAKEEFDQFVARLRAKGVDIIVIEDTVEPKKLDAVFPNNWITSHADGTIVTYPICAPIRRLERRMDIIESLSASFSITRIRRMEDAEADNRFLEGTGSMIFDRTHGIAYACVSPRTDPGLLREFCELVGCREVCFRAVDSNNQDIYHTNVMMAIGETFVVICMDTLRDEAEKKHLLSIFEETKKEVIAISLDQMMSFAGNMLQVRNDQGETFLVMSSQAHASLSPAQIIQIEKHTQILHSPIDTIETYGGGSARCMMAEIFLPTL